MAYPKMNAQQMLDAIIDAAQNNRPMGSVPWDGQQIKNVDGSWGTRNGLTQFEARVMQQQASDLVDHIDEYGPKGNLKALQDDFGLRAPLSSFKLPYQYHFSGSQGLNPGNFMAGDIDAEHRQGAGAVKGGYTISPGNAHLINSFQGPGGRTGQHAYMVLGDGDPFSPAIHERVTDPYGNVSYELSGHADQSIYSGDRPFNEMIYAGTKDQLFDRQGSPKMFAKPQGSFANYLSSPTNAFGKLHSGTKANAPKSDWVFEMLRNLR